MVIIKWWHMMNSEFHPNYFHIRKILKLSDLDFNSFNSVNGLLTTSEIEHFILNNLEIRTDNTTESMNYNDIIDNYLKTTDRLDFQLLTKMAKIQILKIQNSRIGSKEGSNL